MESQDLDLTENPGNGERRKRTVEEIQRDVEKLTGTTTNFIYDDFNLDDFELSTKRPRWDQPEEIIKIILEERNKRQQLTSSEHDSKTVQYPIKQNSITTRVPTWDFVAATRPSDGQRVYIRVRPKSDPIVARNRPATGLLSVSYSQLKAEAEEIMVKNAKRASMSQLQVGDLEVVHSELWVDKYRPKRYLDLLSDETINKTFLRWLKLWDKVVFNREPFKLKKKEEKSNFRKFNKQNLMEQEVELDEKGFPKHRIALLSGSPGLGKTTLAHIAARHSGYNVVEINASDDRSPRAFKEALHSATQMQAVLGEKRKPNCIILDEIDGAPAASIELLLKFVLGKQAEKGKKTKENQNRGCARPVICICNEIFTPSLRPLKAMALVLQVPEINPSLLTDRLLVIAESEKLRVDRQSVKQLVERSGCDVRSCLGAIQYMGGVDVNQNVSLGIKDTRTGLFDTWREVFQVPFNKSGIISTKDRAKRILKLVQQGESDKLAQGVFHNYPLICKDNLKLVSESLEWFQFFDIVSTHVSKNQVWTIMPYTSYAFPIWHLNLSASKYPKLAYPSITYEVNQRLARTNTILAAVQKIANVDKMTLCLDILPLLLDVLNPRLRSVSAQLYSTKEKEELKGLINIMLDYGLAFLQEKKLEGGYEYNLDPNINLVGSFPGCKVRRSLPYAVKQIVIQELEVERLQRSARMFSDKEISEPTKRSVSSKKPEQPNLSKTLSPVDPKPPASKKFFDFFKSFKDLGKEKAAEIEASSPKPSSSKETEPEAVEPRKKSCVYYKYKEGYTNAVRKPVYMRDLL